MLSMWQPVELEHNYLPKNDRLLYDLAYGKYSALLIRNFYDKDYCRMIANRITDISSFNYGTGIIKKVGIFLMAYVNKKSDYFREIVNVEKTFRMIFDRIEDPRNRICELIANLMPEKRVTIAEDKGQRYSSAIIRIHETGDSGPLHRDNAMADAGGFNIARFPHQLSCVLYIQQSESGGELVIYKRLWKPSDERFRDIGFGYSNKVLDYKTESVIIRAAPGDLLIINPKFFHEILPVTGKMRRITLGMFMAFGDSESYVATWS